jgi:hypothetical protein
MGAVTFSSRRYFNLDHTFDGFTPETRAKNIRRVYLLKRRMRRASLGLFYHWAVIAEEEANIFHLFEFGYQGIIYERHISLYNCARNMIGDSRYVQVWNVSYSFPWKFSSLEQVLFNAKYYYFDYYHSKDNNCYDFVRYLINFLLSSPGTLIHRGYMPSRYESSSTYDYEIKL